MTYQQIKKVIRGMMTIADYEKRNELYQRVQQALKEDKAAYIAAVTEYAAYEADWVWRIIEATGTNSYHAKKYWMDVGQSLWLEAAAKKRNQPAPIGGGKEE